VAGGALSAEQKAGDFRYQVVTAKDFDDDADLTALLNKQAADGWELVGVVGAVYNNTGLSREQSRGGDPNRILTKPRFVFRK
jgi:Domain of unknown function (DUF4177)